MAVTEGSLYKVKITGLSFAYHKDSPLFQDFNWDIATGERWSIIGPSGCGKTTLLYLLAGLRQPNQGQIAILPENTHGHQLYAGLILQDYGLLPWATAFQNVLLGLKIHKVNHRIGIQTAYHWLLKMGIEAVANHFPAELSGGQRQRVAIARTLALEPDLLLMDEPFASLDTLTRENLLELTLGLWQDRPSTMILVTHNIEEAVFWGQKVLVLNTAPNSHPQILENNSSGFMGYRHTPQFIALCDRLRKLMEQFVQYSHPECLRE
jgi:NitT/TauT family transport system ATP-binding protein